MYGRLKKYVHNQQVGDFHEMRFINVRHVYGNHIHKVYIRMLYQ